MKPWRAGHWPKVSSLLPILIAAMTGATVFLAPGSTENAVANGDTRTIHLHHAHTKEAIDATYMVDGRYDPVVLEKLNWFLRDWRRDEPTHMDPKLFDVIWEVYRESGAQQPIEVMSAYRSPETNSMLRHATRGVAEHSQHILGKAMDQHYVDVPMSKIREIAMRLQRGGVGFYPTAGTPFVHMDVGGVRHWPRMSYDQLARLFPDGKTVHIPSNGQPLPGYEMARAELESRGDNFNYPTAGEVKSKGFFAWLFGGSDDDGDGEAARDGGSPRDTAPTPAPRRRGATQVAAADPAPVGSTSSDGVIANNKDAGVHLFSFFDSKPDEVPAAVSAAAPAPSNRRGTRGRTQVASLPPAQPTDVEAQQTLALEMQRREQAKAALAQATAQAQAVAQAQQQAATAQAGAAAQAEAATQAQAATDASAPTAVPLHPLTGSALAGRSDMPLPPRRPTELAALGPAAPVPPSRPDDAARSDHAPTPGTARSAAALSPLARAALPSAITQGFGQTPPPRVLAFAPPAAPVPAVPLPVARPQLVAARLDRTNFRNLTGATPAERQVPRAGMGSSVAALRPAAQASVGAISADTGSVPRRGFGARATDLPTDRFSGSATTTQERVSTATLHKRSAATTADD